MRAAVAPLTAVFVVVVVVGGAAAPARADGISVMDLCAHLPHKDVCDGVEPYEPYGSDDRTTGTVSTAVKLGSIAEPSAIDDTQRIYALELDAWATFGRRSAFLTTMQIGGGSDGGTWLRYEAGYGLGRTTARASYGAWGMFGFDVLSERLGFSLVVGGGARVAIRLPRLTVEAVGDYRYRNYDDLMDPTAPGPNRWLPRGRLNLLLGHRVNDFADQSYYGTRLGLEVEEWEGTRVYWLSFGTGLVFGRLPR